MPQAGTFDPLMAIRNAAKCNRFVSLMREAPSFARLDPGIDRWQRAGAPQAAARKWTHRHLSVNLIERDIGVRCTVVRRNGAKRRADRVSPRASRSISRQGDPNIRQNHCQASMSAATRCRTVAASLAAVKQPGEGPRCAAFAGRTWVTRCPQMFTSSNDLTHDNFTTFFMISSPPATGAKWLKSSSAERRRRVFFPNFRVRCAQPCRGGDDARLSSPSSARRLRRNATAPSASIRSPRRRHAELRELVSPVAANECCNQVLAAASGSIDRSWKSSVLPAAPPSPCSSWRTTSCIRRFALGRGRPRRWNHECAARRFGWRRCTAAVLLDRPHPMRSMLRMTTAAQAPARANALEESEPASGCRPRHRADPGRERDGHRSQHRGRPRCAHRGAGRRPAHDDHAVMSQLLLLALLRNPGSSISFAVTGNAGPNGKFGAAYKRFLSRAGSIEPPVCRCPAPRPDAAGGHPAIYAAYTGPNPAFIDRPHLADRFPAGNWEFA